jgi:hypothetical protein
LKTGESKKFNQLETRRNTDGDWMKHILIDPRVLESGNWNLEAG